MLPDDRLAHVELLLEHHRALLVEVRGLIERLALESHALREHLVRHDGQLALLQQHFDAQEARLLEVQLTLDALTERLARREER